MSRGPNDGKKKNPDEGYIRFKKEESLRKAAIITSITHIGEIVELLLYQGITFKPEGLTTTVTPCGLTNDKGIRVSGYLAPSDSSSINLYHQNNGGMFKPDERPNYRIDLECIHSFRPLENIIRDQQKQLEDAKTLGAGMQEMIQKLQGELYSREQ